MAQIEDINVASESMVIIALTELAHKVADSYGIRINTVSLDWIDLSTAAEQSYRVADCRVTLSAKPEWDHG